MASLLSAEDVIALGCEQRITLGNSGRDDAALCADYLNEAGQKSWGLISEDCFIGYSTLKRMAEEGGSDSYRPQYETVKRIKIYFQIQTINIVVDRITPKHQNKPKDL